MADRLLTICLHCQQSIPFEDYYDHVRRCVHGAVPKVRTHSVRSAYINGDWCWQCRGCGECWGQLVDPNAIEQQPCGTRSDEP